MRTGRKLQNRERVEKCKETLDQLSRFMGDILDGKLSQREAAEALGLTAQGLSHELNSCFKKYLKYSHVFSDEDIKNLLGDVETPAEKLAKDVLQVGEDGRYLLVNKECQKDFIEEVKNTLNERDYTKPVLRSGRWEKEKLDPNCRRDGSQQQLHRPTEKIQSAETLSI